MVCGFVKRAIPALIACVLAAGAVCGCKRKENSAGPAPEYAAFRREVGDIDFSGIDFTPWNVSEASLKLQKRDKKPYTVMVYMNGSDLESQGGAATKDLIEMLNSGLRRESANLIVFTGGTNRWQNGTVPAGSCCIWEILDGKIHKAADLGLLNMGNPGTLSGFIDFCLASFPAEKSGLILWDHGGGSIAGFGHDEKFKNGTLTLLKMNLALEKSLRGKEPLEFIGFDSCLMASAEMAVVASDYARCLIASEDLEPGDGWDYGFLSVLNEGQPDGIRIGKAVTDSFIGFYGAAPDTDLALSVTDLAGAKGVMEAMGRLMNLCSGGLAAQPSKAFRTLAQRRSATKTFGIGSPRDNESDMVDLGEMARSLLDVYPAEAEAVLNALSRAVAYNRHNADAALGGLSAFYIYGGKNTAEESLAVYSSLKMDPNYTAYLHRFYKHLAGGSGFFLRSHSQDGGTEPFELTLWEPADGGRELSLLTGVKEYGDKNPLWPQINGLNVCLYRTGGTDDRRLYAVPASINGRDADLIIVVGGARLRGRVLGARNEEGFILQKGLDEIKDGDKISFYYESAALEGSEGSGNGRDWQKGAEFKVKGGLKLGWAEKRKDAFCRPRYKDFAQNVRYGSVTQPAAA